MVGLPNDVDKYRVCLTQRQPYMRSSGLSPHDAANASSVAAVLRRASVAASVSTRFVSSDCVVSTGGAVGGGGSNGAKGGEGGSVRSSTLNDGIVIPGGMPGCLGKCGNGGSLYGGGGGGDGADSCASPLCRGAVGWQSILQKK